MGILHVNTPQDTTDVRDRWQVGQSEYSVHLERSGRVPHLGLNSSGQEVLGGCKLQGIKESLVRKAEHPFETACEWQRWSC